MMRAMATVAPKRRMDPERRREHLLDVASDYIGERGTEVRLDDIAQEAGISPALMRHYFKNLDGLLAVLTEQACAELEAIFLAPGGGDLGQRLARYLAWVPEHQWAHWLWVAATGRNPNADLATTRRRLMEATVGLEWEAQDLDTRTRANAWVAAIEATVTAWLNADRQDTEDTVKALLDVAARLDVVGAKPALRAWKRRAAA